jgi:hypothetical protein
MAAMRKAASSVLDVLMRPSRGVGPGKRPARGFDEPANLNRKWDRRHRFLWSMLCWELRRETSDR